MPPNLVDICTYLKPSHAHEEDVPGTVNLRAIEGDDTAYGKCKVDLLVYGISC